MRVCQAILLSLILAQAACCGQERTAVVVSNALIKVYREVDVSFEVSGILHQVEIKEGDQVSADAALASLRDTRVRFELRRREIEWEDAKMEARNQLMVDDARLAAAVALSEYNRVLQANELNQQTYRQAEVDRFKLLADRSALAVKQAEHELKAKRVDEMLAKNEWELMVATCDQYTLRAPWAGTVVSVDKVAGEWVEAGTKIGRLVDDSRLRVEGFVSSSFSPDDLVGRVAVVSLNTSEAPLGETPKNVKSAASIRGTVVFVSPDINPVNRLARIFIEIDNQEGSFRPGSKVDVRIPLLQELKAHESTGSSEGR